ncbi:MAG: zinc ribbon domain-containing protein [bacterium]
MQILHIIPGTTKWLFLVAVAAFYGIGWVAWRVQNDCTNRGYSPVATTFWSVGTLFAFFPVFPLYLMFRERSGLKAPPVSANAEGAEPPQILCMACGSENDAVLSACLTCGAPLVGNAGADTGVGSVSCPLCGAQNRIGAHECQSCHQLL